MIISLLIMQLIVQQLRINGVILQIAEIFTLLCAGKECIILSCGECFKIQLKLLHLHHVFSSNLLIQHFHII